MNRQRLRPQHDVRDTPENLVRAQRALKEFGAPDAVIEALPQAAPMGAPPARIDLMKSVPGGNFDRAWTTRETHDIAGTSVSVVSRDELIRLKRASGPPQDLVDVQNLERLTALP